MAGNGVGHVCVTNHMGTCWENGTINTQAGTTGIEVIEACVGAGGKMGVVVRGMGKEGQGGGGVVGLGVWACPHGRSHWGNGKGTRKEQVTMGVPAW